MAVPLVPDSFQGSDKMASKASIDMASKAVDSMLGAGFDVSKTRPGDQHPAGPPQHGPMGQAERAFSAGSTFLSGVLA